MKIGVTGLNATDNPGPGVPVIRSLQEATHIKTELIGLIYDSLEPGIYMDNLAQKNYLIPYPSSGLENMFERIKYIHDKEHLDFIIPNLDSELFGFVKLKNRLNELGIKTFLPTFEQLMIRGKDKLFDFCTQHDIKVPKNILITSQNDLYSIPKHFTYPVVVKGIFYEAYIANNFEEVITGFNKLRVKWGFPIIIQEYIAGSEYNVVALGDGKGNTIGAVPMKKLYITDKGKGWAGVTINDSTLLELTHKIMQKTEWQSGLELEFMKSNETNEYYLLEINPRFPAWVHLATAAGQNLPEALIRLALSENIDPFTSYKIGTIFIRGSWDFITDMSVFEKITTMGEI
ncbi:MAG: ATP-grasp domain-containing protein [Ignavibacteria bacterium]|nr:ATP-grasp domain-containing protein [Ignavibacteria bacterium]